MKKKKILYSEFTSVAAPVAAVLKAKLAPEKSASAVLAAPVALERAAAPVSAPPEHIARLITPMRGMPRVTPMRGTPVIASARTLRDRVRARSGKAELLLFRVAGERFAIELGAVEEAIDLPPVHHVPEMPPAMLGVITVRGTLTPVYSPQAALGLALTDGASALIFKRGRHRFGLVIDDVEDVMPLDLATLRDAPGIEDPGSVLLGVVRQRDALLALVDTETLLATCQAVPLLETA
jgi:purine-binding chemotaxis protein CheW